MSGLVWKGAVQMRHSAHVGCDMQAFLDAVATLEKLLGDVDFDKANIRLVRANDRITLELLVPDSE